jgi:hypothetical protein
MAGGGAFAGGGILASAGSGGLGGGPASAGQHPSVMAAASLMASHLQAGQYHKVGCAAPDPAASHSVQLLSAAATLLSRMGNAIASHPF